MSINKLLMEGEYERAFNRVLRMPSSTMEDNLKQFVNYCMDKDGSFLAIQWAYDAAEKLRRHTSRRKAMLQIVEELWRQYCSCCGVEDGYWRKWVRLLMRSINHLSKEKQEEYFHLFTGNARLWRWDDIKEAIDMAKRYPCHACYAAKWEIRSRIEERYGWTNCIPFLRLYWKGKSKAKLEKWLNRNFKKGYGRLILEEFDNPANIFLCSSWD